MKRWPIIRHARWLYWHIRFTTWWNDYGHVLGAFPNPADLEHMEKIWKGEA